MTGLPLAYTNRHLSGMVSCLGDIHYGKVIYRGADPDELVTDLCFMRANIAKVRSEPAIYLKDCFVLFAAYFIRRATYWLAQQALPAKNAIDVH